MKLLGDVDGDEVSLVKRAANRRRFLLLKGDDKLDTELADILDAPWEREGALLDEIRKSGVDDETVERAVIAAVRLIKGVESEFSPELVEKIGVELYGRKNPKLNSGGSDSQEDLDGTAGHDGELDGSGSHDGDTSGSGRDGELSGTGKKAPKVADDSDGNDAEPDDDADDKGKGKRKLFGGKKAKPFSKSDDTSDNDDAMEHDNEGGTVEVQVPVRKEDGTWDLTDVPSESRPFFEEMIAKADKADKTEKELEEAKEQLAKADDTLRTRETLAKAASYSHVAPTDDLAPILKEASEKFDSETYEKFESLLGAAEERITKGGLFAEMGRSQGTSNEEKSDAWTEAVKKAEALVEKSDTPMSQDQALAKVWESNPDLYNKYLSDSGMGVTY